MSDSRNETTFDNKVKILAEIWVDHDDNEELSDFIEYNDLGLPLAYALHHDIVIANDKTRGFIIETFQLLLDGHEQEDTGFTSTEDLLRTLGIE
jgi:hypothetical protein